MSETRLGGGVPYRVPHDATQRNAQGHNGLAADPIAAMPVSRDDAEEYELAGMEEEEELRVGSSSSPNENEDDSEHARLLTEEGKLSEEVDDFIRAAHEDDLGVGKSSNVEQLIARVGVTLWLADTRAFRRLTTRRSRL